ncbi:MAG: hypothetical protein IKK61_05610 [Clostridia bacterium]|nr:hypothetical protein [Clostridia bacterium]
MEERKKLGPLGIAGLILLLLLLAAVCFLSAGLPDLSMGMGPWGFYTTDGRSLYHAEVYREIDTRDLLITDRSQVPSDGQVVTYLLNGQRTVDLYDDLLGRPVLAWEEGAVFTAAEPVVKVLPGVGTVLRVMHHWCWYIWGAAAGFVLVLVVLKLTANARWRKRQQKLMVKNFQKFGEKYAREEEELDY